MTESLTIALSKGRILDDTLPLLAAAGIEPLDDPRKSRKLIFDTNQPNIKLVIIRAADVPTFVEFGAADLGVAGKDVYGGKVKALGVGYLPFGKSFNRKYILANDINELRRKYKEEFRSAQGYTANDKLNDAMNKVAVKINPREKRVSVAFFWQITEGPSRGKVSLCYVDNDGKWIVDFLNKSTEFTLET